MDVTKSYESIGFVAKDVTKPYKSIGLGAEGARAERMKQASRLGHALSQQCYPRRRPPAAKVQKRYINWHLAHTNVMKSHLAGMGSWWCGVEVQEALASLGKP